jgi:hypothetical protein
MIICRTVLPGIYISSNIPFQTDTKLSSTIAMIYEHLQNRYNLTCVFRGASASSLFTPVYDIELKIYDTRVKLYRWLCMSQSIKLINGRHM